MANAPTKTKLHDQLEAIILNTRRLIEEKVEANAITKTRAEQLRSEMQKKIAGVLAELDERVVEELLSQETVPQRSIAFWKDKDGNRVSRILIPIQMS